MAWLQDIAHKTENLLDKIDKGANSLFNENSTPDSGRYTEITINNDLYAMTEIADCMDPQLFEDNSTKDNSTRDDSTKDNSIREDSNYEWYRNELDIIQSNYENKMVDLERHNDKLSKQLLNLHHSFSEISNENESLKVQLQQAKDCALSVENEMQDYKKKVQRALHEKNNVALGEIPNNINEDLRKKLEYYEELNGIISQKVQTVTENFNNLQNEYKTLQNSNDASMQSLQNNLEAERRIRISTENDNRAKNAKIKTLLAHLDNQTKLYEEQNKEYENLKAIMNQSEETYDLTMRVQSLTNALISKQNRLETLSTEKNVLKLQLEKIRNEYHETIKEKQDKRHENLEFTRKAKGNESLNAKCWSYFNKSKFSRTIVLTYFIFLHIWVLVILCYYVPK